jgi:alpha-amylase
MKKSLSVFLAIIMIFCITSIAPINSVSTKVSAVNNYGLADSIDDGVILHAWCWSFSTIKNKLPDIAAAGYTSIQTSPINQILVGDNGGMQLYGNGKWYYFYQPTDYTIGNYILGTEDEFKSLCIEAHKYGIKIIVDVVLNHCTSNYDAISQNVKNIASATFHQNGIINDYNSRWNITQCSLDGLYDFNTQDSAVQQFLKNYIDKVLNSGADGLRFDAAKHVELPNDEAAFSSNFWPTITNNNSQFQYLEVLQDSTGTDRFSDYANYGHITASTYGYIVRESVDAKDLRVSRISSYYSSGVNANNLVTWVESHDNYCNDKSWQLVDDNEVKLGWALITARGATTPLFFSRPANSSASNIWGNNLMGAEGSSLYKDAEVSAVNKFHNAMVGESEKLSNPAGNNGVLMIERGTKGAVIINTTNSDVNISNSSCNIESGSYADKVSGSSFTVTNGVIFGTVKAGKIAVIYNDNSKPSVSASKESGDFYEPFTVTLSVANATSARYHLNNGASIPFNNGATVTIGDNMAVGDSVTLNLYATNEYGSSEKSYTYTKVKKPSITGTVVYYDNSVTKWNDVYCYCYDGGGYTNAAWPGVKMTALSNNIYYYVIDSSLNSANVLFNNNSGAQYPASGEPGLAINKNEQKILNSDYSWTAYSEPDTHLPCDLYASAVSPTSSTAIDGESVNFSVIVRNMGENATDGDFTVNFYVDGVFKESVTVSDSIAPNGFKPIVTKNGWSSFFGGHSVRAVVVTGDLDDVNSTNNAIKNRFKVSE